LWLYNLVTSQAISIEESKGRIFVLMKEGKDWIERIDLTKHILALAQQKVQDWKVTMPAWRHRDLQVKVKNLELQLAKGLWMGMEGMKQELIDAQVQLRGVGEETIVY
jgi:hypothetical protein